MTFSRTRQLIRRSIQAVGYDLVKLNSPRPEQQYPPDLSEHDVALFRMVQPYSMTPIEAIYALAEAVRYVTRSDVPGTIVECGVWKGGSMMAVARTLLDLDVRDRDLYLFDTFNGMPPPSEHDVDLRGRHAADLLATADRSSTLWAISPLDETRRVLHSVGYPTDRIHFVSGRVEETLPKDAPSTIALLRLDVDWYEPTHHALVHLFPRLSRGGVLILDDYGYWRGARKAVDEYFRERKLTILLNRINFTVRIGINV